MALYGELLADILGYVLKKAVEACIAQAAWFPKISELRKAAARVAGTGCFWELPETNIDNLRGSYHPGVILGFRAYSCQDGRP